LRISALIASFNTDRYVAAAIESMLAQSVGACEVIAVDDGSTDRTVEVLRGFGDRIRLIEAPHRGAAAAFNAAVTAATGSVLAFNDADDLWVPEKLAIQSRHLDSDPQLDAVFGAGQQFVSPDWESPEHGAGVAPPQPGISKIGMLIRRSAFERIGQFDTGYQFLDFFDWYLRGINRGLRARTFPEIVAFRRLHAGNITRVRRAETRAEALLSLKRSLDLRRGKIPRQLTEASLHGRRIL
jgi:glycosyltransferase involved in cell wall biosynthesis